MLDGLQVPEKPDELVSAVSRRISELADGNPHPAAGFSFEGSRQDRMVRLTMRVDVAGSQTSLSTRGKNNPAGSTRRDDVTSAGEFLASAVSSAKTSSDTLEKVLTRLRVDPVCAFAELEDGFDVGVIAGQCHVHLACKECGQTGSVTCRNCNGGGTLHCPNCSYGKQMCGCITGTILTTEYVWNPSLGQNQSVTVKRNCGTCGGSARVTCQTCYGKAQIMCMTCRGGGWLGCVTCGKTGWLTVATVARLVGKPVRAFACEDGAPQEFRNAISGVPIREIPGPCGKITRHLVTSADGVAGLAIECLVPHVVITGTFTEGFRQRFDAVGLPGLIPSMPRFLDRLLASLDGRIYDAAEAGRHAEVLTLAKESRLTCSVLLAASRSDGLGSKDLCRLWLDAATEAFVSGLLEQVRTAYDAIGSAAARGPWRILALPVVVLAGASIPLHFGRALMRALPFLGPIRQTEGAEMLASAALGLLPLAAAYFYAGRHARRVVRSLVGPEAARVPAQGGWSSGTALAAGAAILSGVFWAGLAPSGPVATSFPSHAVVRPQSALAVPNRLNRLAPDGLPPLMPVFRIDATRGAPDVFWLQVHLGQLGFYRAEPDGVMRQSIRDAMARFAVTLPSSRRLPSRPSEAAATAAAALRDEFSLQRLPVDRLRLPGLSNLVRSNLTGADVASMQRAEMAAVADPGREISWRSADGRRSGRVVATMVPGSCPYFHVEVVVRGMAQTVGPLSACFNQQQGNR